MWYALDRPSDGGCGATIALTGIETSDRLLRSRRESATDGETADRTDWRKERLEPRVESARSRVKLVLLRARAAGDGGRLWRFGIEPVLCALWDELGREWLGLGTGDEESLTRLRC